MKKSPKIEPITRKEAALRRGCSPATATRFFAGPGADAVLPDGSIDALHPVVVAWIAAGKRRKSAPQTDRDQTTNVPDRAAFLTLKFRKSTAETERLESRNARDEAALISRQLVRTNVVSYLDVLSRNLLSSFALTAAVRMAAAVRTGATPEENRALLEGLLTQEIKTAKRQVSSGLKASRTGDNPPEVSERPKVDPEQRKVKALADALRLRLRTSAAKMIVEFCFKEVARAACGEHWNPTVFDEVMTTHPSIADETARTIGSMLTSHVDAAVTATQQMEDTDVIQ